MNPVNRIFHGKVMLFGEYSVITGSHAALVPYTKVSARLDFSMDQTASRSNCILNAFSSFLKHLHATGDIMPDMDFERLFNDIDAGLYLQSDIPESRGLGSSGALCAAVYWSYQIRGASGDLARLRAVFSAMESYFHGSSSGVDPLCIFVDQPLVIKDDQYLLPGENRLFLNNPQKPFLFPTGNGSSTSSLVEGFLERIQSGHFREGFIKEYVPLVNHAVDSWLNGGLNGAGISRLSAAQQQWLREMIPPELIEIWEKGLSSGLYSLKICGSGGGGMVLGFTDNIDETSRFLKTSYDLNTEPLNF